MTPRSVYLAMYRGSASQRAHFALFIPNATDDRSNISQDFRSISCKGIIIHVVGEPVMNGYTHEFKRNYETNTSRDLQELVLLGQVDSVNLYDPPNNVFVKGVRISELQSTVLTLSGVKSGLWSTHRLLDRGLISPSAVDTAQNQRNPPKHGVLGQG
ncbi:hypothetical protein BKA67DRAFT_665069 [Truncatella angustata]|uniref:Uncharacterized protein n=1 Tax=Truncatella angustata TaxID=152316 RepID=A0A9P8RFT8_9PEZI|nr:uncharacterized protein BKA67DRAFT_665069 [Truncatella angustata]KAH6645233.1 hypothetical protein BKA67DRAFT_665069 [Truncatella angustata]